MEGYIRKPGVVKKGNYSNTGKNFYSKMALLTVKSIEVFSRGGK
jgi:hypothetical protein